MKNRLSVAITFSKDVEDFLENKIFKEMNISELNDDNISDVTSYVSNTHEIPYVQGCSTKEERTLLKIASKTVTELTYKELIDL